MAKAKTAYKREIAPARAPTIAEAKKTNTENTREAIRAAADRQARLFDPAISREGIDAALTALDREWKWPLSREDLARVIVSAYLGAANAKR